MKNNMDEKEKDSTPTLSPAAKNLFLHGLKWAKALSVLGFVGLAMTLVQGVFMMFGIPVPLRVEELIPFDFGIEITNFIPYLITVIVGITPNLYLWRMSTHLTRGIENDHKLSIETGIKNFKMIFTYWGRVALIGILMRWVVFFYTWVLV